MVVAIYGSSYSQLSHKTKLQWNGDFTINYLIVPGHSLQRFGEEHCDRFTCSLNA